MTEKKFWEWLESPYGNLITPYERFDLKQIDPITELPVKDYKPNYKNNFERTTLEEIPVAENPTDKLDTSLNIFEWIKAKIYTTKKEAETKMIDTLKNFIVGFVTRWILKIGGGFLLSVGLASGKVEEIVGAIVSIVVCLLISLFQQKKALETDLKTLQK